MNFWSNPDASQIYTTYSYIICKYILSVLTDSLSVAIANISANFHLNLHAKFTSTNLTNTRPTSILVTVKAQGLNPNFFVHQVSPQDHVTGTSVVSILVWIVNLKAVLQTLTEQAPRYVSDMYNVYI